MLHIFAGVQAETATSSTEERQKEETPQFRGSPMLILDIRHCQIVAAGAPNLDWMPGIACLLRVVRSIGDSMEVDILIGVHDRAQVVVIADNGLAHW